MPDDASWLDGVVVPDDLSDLQADVEAYHRELRHTARRRRIARVTGTRAWQRLALPVAVAVGSLTVAAAVFSILTLGHPRSVAGPPRAPVASAAGLPAPGDVDGLLPDVTVRTSGGAMSVRDLRPALIALVPLRCNCTALMSSLAAQAAEVGVHLVVVAPANQDAEVDSLAGRVHSGTVLPVFDLHAELQSAYAATGVTVVGVRSDATVNFVQRSVGTDVRLEPWLTQMVQPIESLSAR